jgi:acylphosphatase
VHGRVQGVFFRAFVSENARKLGLTGFVRNMPDGTVEAVAEGEKDSLEKLLGLMREGSPAARVDRVAAQWSDYSGEYRRFSAF